MRPVITPLGTISLNYYTATAKHPIRVLFDEDGHLWFVAKDVASALGYQQPGKLAALARENTAPENVPTASLQGQSRPAAVVNLRALREVLKRRQGKHHTRPFAKWLNQDALPRARRLRDQAIPVTAPAEREGLAAPQSTTGAVQPPSVAPAQPTQGELLGDALVHHSQLQRMGQQVNTLTEQRDRAQAEATRLQEENTHLRGLVRAYLGE